MEHVLAPGHLGTGHVLITVSIKQSQVSIQGAVFRSLDKFRPIRGQYSGHVTSIDQSQASIT